MYVRITACRSAARGVRVTCSIATTEVRRSSVCGGVLAGSQRARLHRLSLSEPAKQLGIQVTEGSD